MSTMNKTPVITITCNRDLPLPELQAQSIALYLDKGTPVYIIVNEADTTKWFKEFDNKIAPYYQNHNQKQNTVSVR